jgi:CRP-like cAMP-binding protein
MNSLIPRKFETSHPRQNHLLAALPDAEWSRWLPHLELVDLSTGKVLCESSSPITCVYFPTTAVISLLCTTVQGGTSEIAAVGNDGVVGICMIMGGQAMLNRAVVQSAGQAYRLPAALVKAEVERSGPALRLLMRYAQSLITQVTQTAACNRHHSIDQQLARRLLIALDCSTSDEFAMTQEGVASLLGVRREGVTAAALKLQRAGVIRYQRGQISVLDRNRLEHHACECYAAVAKEHSRLLPTLGSAAPKPIAALRGLPLTIARPLATVRRANRQAIALIHRNEPALSFATPL